MNARRTDWQDLLFGLFLIAVAGIALAATRTLSGGNAADMGPGYMPRVIAIMLLGFGLWFSIRGIRRPFVGIAPVRLQPLLAITADLAWACRDRKSTRLNSSHSLTSRMPSSA